MHNNSTTTPTCTNCGKRPGAMPGTLCADCFFTAREKGKRR